MNTKITKYDKSISFCNAIDKALDDETLDVDKIYVIILIHKYCDKIIEKFDYDFLNLYNSIKKLDSAIVDGEVYMITGKSNLILKDYKLGYLFLMENSCLFSSINDSEKDDYIVLYGDRDSIKPLDHNYTINSVKSDTIIKVYKYIPENIRK